MDLTDLANFDTPAFPVAVAAAACATEPGTLRMWFVRKLAALLAKGHSEYGAPTAEPEKGGLPRLLTYRTVLTLAAAAPLVGKGVDVAAAFKAAQQWTYFGEGWNGQGACPRDPASLFAPPAFTVLIHRADAMALVVAVTSDGKGHLPFQLQDLFGTGFPVRQAPTLVLLNSVEKYARGVCEGFLR